MTRWGWIVAAALGAVLLVAVALGFLWFGWDWKALIGWRALVDYINPKNATGRKDAVQVYALITAGVVASITAAVGLLNLRLTRKNLEQQRELEAQRAEQQRELAQGNALQAYYEQIGKLITECNLRNTKREEIRELARGQTLTVLQEVDGYGKGSLLTFLHGAGLIRTGNPAVTLIGANLQEAELQGADLRDADLREVVLRGANLQGAILRQAYLQVAHLQGANLQANLLAAILELAHLQGADLRNAFLRKAVLRGALLQGADLREAYLEGANLQDAELRGALLQGADLQGADLQGAHVTDEQLADVQDLRGATMPDGQKYEDWLKDKEGSGKDVENE
jgi:uncharacterized protein YjbI with pentapeptide repeats